MYNKYDYKYNNFTKYIIELLVNSYIIARFKNKIIASSLHILKTVSNNDIGI